MRVYIDKKTRLLFSGGFLVIAFLSFQKAVGVEVSVDQFSENAIGLECEKVSNISKFKYFVVEVDQKVVFEWSNEDWRSQPLSRVTANEIEWSYWQVFSYQLNRKNLSLTQFGFANYQCVIRKISEIPDQVNSIYEGNKI